MVTIEELTSILERRFDWYSARVTLREALKAASLAEKQSYDPAEIDAIAGALPGLATRIDGVVSQLRGMQAGGDGAAAPAAGDGAAEAPSEPRDEAAAEEPAAEAAAEEPAGEEAAAGAQVEASVAEEDAGEDEGSEDEGGAQGGGRSRRGRRRK